MNGGENVKKTPAASGSTAPGIISATPGDDLAAKPNPSSIMSAPRDPKKNSALLIILILAGLLIGSVIINVIGLGLALARGTEIKRLERDIKDNEAVIQDLKERLHEQ